MIRINPEMSRQVSSRRSLTSLRSALLVFILGALSTCALASGYDHFELTEPNMLSLSAIGADGTTSASAFFCASSADTNSKNPNSRDLNYPYWLTVQPVDSNEFLLFKGGEATAQDAIPVQISHRDLLAGTGYELLRPGQQETHQHDGQFRECETNGLNSALKFEVDLQNTPAVSPGLYAAVFIVSGVGGLSGTVTDSMEIEVQIVIEASDSLVRISRLDDILLGSYAGTGRLQATESFCVYSSTSAYRISVTGSNSDGGQFQLAENQSGESLPVSVSFADNALGLGSVPYTGIPLTASGDSNAENCLGTDNASLTVSIEESDLRAASTGNYTETLTLVVEPE